MNEKIVKDITENIISSTRKIIEEDVNNFINEEKKRIYDRLFKFLQDLKINITQEHSFPINTMSRQINFIVNITIPEEVKKDEQN